MDDGKKVIEVLGPGCARCFETHRVVQHVVDEAKLEAEVRKVDSIDRMVELGVLSTPAVVGDGTVVLSGRIPQADEVRRLLGLSCCGNGPSSRGSSWRSRGRISSPWRARACSPRPSRGCTS